MTNEPTTRPDPARGARGRGGRDGPPLLIIGLDGVTFDVLDPLMDEGFLPNLRRVVTEGVRGVLHSTIPPVTPAAWTTFLTGLDPGRHGIIDFERYDPLTNRLALNSTRSLDHVRNIWQILSHRGYRVGAINIPMTYPAIPVNGFMVSGFETPGANSHFVYPAELKGDILARWPDPTLRTKWRRKAFGGERLFAANLDYLARSFHQGAAMTRYLGDRFAWDVLMTVLKLTDNLQHKTWRHIDARWRDREPRRYRMVRECFREVDRAVGDMLDYASSHGARVMIASDHGHGSLEGKLQPNLILMHWGYLHLRGGGERGRTRAKSVLDRWLGRRKKFAPVDDVLRDLAVDFSRTRACVMHAGMAAFVYINLQGRQPCGIVPPGDYERLRDELRDRFLGAECRVRDPRGGEVALFSAVHKPEDLYGCSRAEAPWMPDLILIPHRPLAAVRKVRGTDVVRWLPYRRIEGTHRPEGVFMACGPGIRRGGTVELGLIDCAPTILAAVGCPVPNEMQGRVVAEVFDPPPPVTYEPVDSGVARPAASGAGLSTAGEEVYSAEDLEKVTARLADLGYLE
jgi:predicted AlkP superfamily phosphohydrolase/phosphomutase